MPVVAVVEHVAPPGRRVGEEEEGQPDEFEPFDGFGKGDPGRRVRAHRHRGGDRPEVFGVRGRLGEPVAVVRRVDHTVLAGGLLGEEVEAVVEGAHVEDRLVGGLPGQRVGLVADHLALLPRPREVRRTLRRRAGVTPFVRCGRWPLSTLGLPVAGGALHADPQPLHHLMDRLVAAGLRGLGAHRPPVHIEVALCDERTGDGRVGQPGDPQPGGQHRLVGVGRGGPHPLPGMLHLLGRDVSAGFGLEFEGRCVYHG